MLITGHPQFETQDDAGIGDGIPPTPEWQLDSTAPYDGLPELDGIDIDTDYEVRNVFLRLRGVFRRAERIPLSSTRLHDLTCFVVHRILPSASETEEQLSPLTECIRYAMLLYMFVLQGPTYFSHAVVLNTMVTRLLEHYEQLETKPRAYGSLDVWLLSIGMVASAGTAHYQWFVERARAISVSLHLADCDDVLGRVKSVLWLETPQGEGIFKPHWDAIIGFGTQPEPPDFMAYVSSSSSSVGFL